jgi:5,10-methylenetetrahydromethanopterin reductase
VTSRPVLHELGVEMPRAFADAMARCEWSLAREAVAEAGRTLPEDVIARFSLAGSPDDCRSALRGLVENHPQISQVVIVPFAPAGEQVLDVVRRFVEEVAPAGVAPSPTGAA